MYHIANDKRSKQSSMWIFEALERLMQAREYKDIKITDICREAKIGRVTFYRHYDTIEDVLRKRCDDKFDGLAEYFKEFYCGNPKSEPFIKPFLRYWYVHSGILELIIQANQSHIITDCFERMFIMLKTYINEVPESILHYKNYFIAMRVSFSTAILLEWVKENKRIAPDDLTNILIKQMRASMELNSLL